jgi:putative flippase GtrA
MTRFTHLSPSNSRFLRFLIAGAINALFGLAMYSAAILGGLSVAAALAVGNIAGVAFNFFSTGGYVFRSILFARFPRFVTVYALVYMVNLKLIEWLLVWIPGKILAQVLLTLPMALFSYTLMKMFVFGASETRK